MEEQICLIAQLCLQGVAGLRASVNGQTPCCAERGWPHAVETCLDASAALLLCSSYSRKWACQVLAISGGQVGWPVGCPVEQRKSSICAIVNSLASP